MSTTIDLHCDVPWQCYRNSSALNYEQGSTLLQVDFPKMDKGGLDKFVAALYLSDGVQDREGPDRAWNAVRNQADHMRNDRILLGLEGGRLLNRSQERLNEIKSWGVVYVGLTHNRNTDWADSATDNLHHNGLSSFGKGFVKAIQNAGILIDLSHSSDQTALDVINQTDVPVIATHSGVRSLVDHPRNLSDALIKLIVSTGGLIGVPYATRFVKDTDGVVLAIDHIAQLTGSTDYIAIGSDLDGADTVIKNASEWSTILEPLTALGYTNEDLDRIKGGNFMALLARQMEV